MSLFLAKRFATFVATLFGTTVITFLALEILPGDPARVILGVEAPESAVQALREQLGLDRPALDRYLDWVGGLATGNLADSYTYSVPVDELLAARLEITVPLALLAMALSVAMAMVLGVFAAAHHNRRGDVAVMGVSQLGISVPNFWLALLLILLFAVHLRWFSAGGFPGWDAGVGPALKSLLLPALALATVQGAILTRFTRSAVLETMREDYVRTARAKGLTRGQTLRRHVLRNAMIPIVTVMGLQFANLLAGTIVVENVFALPGVGRLILQAITNRDIVVVRDVVTLLAAMVVMINLGVDLLYAAIDPRLKSSDVCLDAQSAPAARGRRPRARRARPRRWWTANRSFAVGAALSGTLVGMAAVSVVWTPYDPTKIDIRNRFAAPSWEHWMGTDQFGRDVLSIIMAGAQNSIVVGVVAVLIGLACGVSLGLLASARRGWVEESIMRFCDFMYAFPAILLAILLVATFGSGAVNAIVAIGIFAIPTFARLTRAAANAVWAREFVLAARAAGKGRLRITVEHVLPNIASVIVVQATVQFALAVLAEAALSYLGIGSQPPTPSWGRMLSDVQTLIFLQPMLAVYPGAAIALSVLGLNLLGDGLRDLADPRLVRKR